MSLSLIGPTAPETSALQPQKAASAQAPTRSSITRQPDTVTISQQGQKAASGDADHDGGSH
jgi:hypothetical protein